jgi:hypothetical protein
MTCGCRACRSLIGELPLPSLHFCNILCRAGLIQRSFERFFWIPEDKSQDASYNIHSHTPWVRGIYKDVLGCRDAWCSLQLRPNQAVAMAVAPFLFDAAHARVRPARAQRAAASELAVTAELQVALKNCRERLLSRMGMRVRRHVISVFRLSCALISAADAGRQRHGVSPELQQARRRPAAAASRVSRDLRRTSAPKMERTNQPPEAGTITRARVRRGASCPAVCICS